MTDTQELEKRVLVGVYAVLEETVTTAHDSPTLGIATHYVRGQEFQYFPSPKMAEEFVQRQQEERLSKDKDLRQAAPRVLTTSGHTCGYREYEVYYSIKKCEFDSREIPVDFELLLQEPQKTTLDPKETFSSGRYEG